MKRYYCKNLSGGCPGYEIVDSGSAVHMMKNYRPITSSGKLSTVITTAGKSSHKANL